MLANFIRASWVETRRAPWLQNFQSSAIGLLFAQAGAAAFFNIDLFGKSTAWLGEPWGGLFFFGTGGPVGAFLVNGTLVTIANWLNAKTPPCRPS